MNKLTLQIAADHPSGTGHFPGNPIIPGALLLAEVLREIARAENMTLAACNIKQAKFQHPARPGDCIDIEYSIAVPGQLKFQCTVNGTIVLSGALSATIQA